MVWFKFIKSINGSNCPFQSKWDWIICYLWINKVNFISSHLYIQNRYKICKQMIYNMPIVEKWQKILKISGKLTSPPFFGVQFAKNWRNSKKKFLMSHNIIWNWKNICTTWFEDTHFYPLPLVKVWVCNC